MSDDLEGRLAALERRLARHDDLEAIRRLKCEHALASDDPEHIKERLLAIVTDDVELDYGVEFGRFRGKAKLAELLDETPFRWTFHLMVPKRIDLAEDGRSATGIWYLWEPATAPDPDDPNRERAMWLAGVYEDTYRKQADGRWLIARMALQMRLMVPYEQGWAARRIVELASGAWTDEGSAQPGG